MPWHDDFFEVDLKKIPMPDIDPSWTSSKSYPREQIDQWISHLAEIQRRSRAAGWQQKDFEKLEQSTDPKERELGKTYGKFYHHGNIGSSMNHDFVKLEWLKDHYEITNGQHRIWLAKQRGLPTMPAHVSAPERKTLEQLRMDGERSASQMRNSEAERKPVWERKSQEIPERDVDRRR